MNVGSDVKIKNLKEFAANDKGRIPPFTLYFVSSTSKGMEEDPIESFANFDDAVGSLKAMYRDDPRTQNFWWIVRDGNNEEVYSDSPWERSEQERSLNKIGFQPPNNEALNPQNNISVVPQTTTFMIVDSETGEKKFRFEDRQDAEQVAQELNNHIKKKKYKVVEMPWPKLQSPYLEERRLKSRKKKFRGAAYGPGPYGWYGFDSGYSGDGGGVAETINSAMLNPRFKHKQKIGDYTYTATAEDFEGAPLLWIKAYDGNKEIGHVMFEIIVRSPGGRRKPSADYLESGGTEVDPAYRNKGVASTMYVYAKMLGNDILPSYNQTSQGRAMWAAWEKAGDAKHLIGTASESAVAEDTLRELPLDEKWSEKYKRSINCSNPRGFSQRAHCQGRKKHNESIYDELFSKKSPWHEVEFICVNPKFDSGISSEQQERLFNTLKHLVKQDKNGDLNIFPIRQDWCEYSPGQKSLSVLYKTPQDLALILNYARQIGVPVDLKRRVSLDYAQRAMAGELEGQIDHDKVKLREVDDNIGEQFWGLMNSVEENFHDGKKPGRKGLAKRVGVNCKQSVSKLRSIAANSSGERQRMAHWCANMKSGKKKSSESVNEADPKFVNFMNQTLANKIDKPDTQDDVPDFYKNAPAHELDGPYGGWGDALRWGIAVIQRMTPAQRERLALKGEKGVVNWLIRLAIKLKVMPDYDTEEGQRMLELGQYQFVEEDLREAIAWLPETFHDPNVRTWLDAVKQGTNLREEKETNDHSSSVYQVLKDFLPVAMSELQLEKLPKIRIVHQLKNGDQPTFGAFSDGGITLAVDGRHPIDICRTLAHELVHHRQRLDNRLNPDSGETGSEEENEANSVAGVIMRNFSREFPHHMSVV